MFRLATVLTPVVILLFARQVPSRGPGEPAGACCLPNANCLELMEAACALIDGSNWAGPGTDCTDFEEIGTADACEVRVPKLYWLGGGSLRRANLDGTELEIMGSADAVSIDWPTGKLYVGGGSIQRRELNGELVSSPTVEILVGSGLASGVVALWVDYASQKLYWSNGAPGQRAILRAGLDIPEGETADNRTDIEEVVSGSPLWFAIIAPSDDCGRATADANHDGDIDLRDFAVFQNCFSGPAK